RAHRRAVGHRGVRRGLAGRQLGGHRRRRRPPHPSPSHAVRDVRRHCPRLHRKGVARLMADITMPQLGETVTEGTITKWFKSVGDEVSEDEPLFEVSTDKVDSEVPSPESGYLAEILVEEGETVDVGTKLAVVSPRPRPATARRVPTRKKPRRRRRARAARTRRSKGA